MSILKVIGSALMVICMAAGVIGIVAYVFGFMSSWLLSMYPFDQLVVSMLLVIALFSGASMYS